MTNVTVGSMSSNLSLPIHTIERFDEKKENSSRVGKILLVSGPPSSGKTTLVEKVIKLIPNFHTICRVDLRFKILPEIDKLFFFDLLSEARTLLGDHVSDSDRLKYEIEKNLESPDNQTRLNNIRSKFNVIIGTKEFWNEYKVRLFTAYYEEMNPRLLRGENIIIDEGFIVTEEDYISFKTCCIHYPYIKIVLLFNTIQEIFDKCLVRNSKFMKNAENQANLDDVLSNIKENEQKSGGSANIFRHPKSIIPIYKYYYNLTSNCKKEDRILQQLNRSEIYILFSNILTAQKSLMDFLQSKDQSHSSNTDSLDVDKEVESFFGQSEIKYVSCKFKYDEIIYASKITSIDLLDNKEFVENLLVNILPWIQSDAAPKSFV